MQQRHSLPPAVLIPSATILDDQCDAIRAAPAAEQYRTVSQVSFFLGQIASQGRISRRDCMRRVYEAATGAGMHPGDLPRLIGEMIDAGIKRGF